MQGQAAQRNWDFGDTTLQRDVAPLFSSYKWIFAIVRTLEVGLGGIRILSVAPRDDGLVWTRPSGIVFQGISWLIPIAITYCFTYLSDPKSDNTAWIALKSIIISFYVGLMRALAYFGAWRGGMQQSMGGRRHGSKYLDVSLDENMYQGDLAGVLRLCTSEVALDCSGLMTLLSQICGGFLQAFVFNWSISLSPETSLVSTISCWMIYGMGIFCLSTRHPVEVAQWHMSPQPLDCFTRGFHVILFFCLSRFHFNPGAFALPFLWLLGLLPSLDVLLEWSVEMTQMHIFGGSAASSRKRLVIHVIVSSIASLLCFYSMRYVNVRVSLCITALLSCCLSSGVIFRAYSLVRTYTVPNTTIWNVLPIMASSTQKHKVQSLQNSGQHIRNSILSKVDTLVIVLCSVSPYFATLSNTSISWSILILTSAGVTILHILLHFVKLPVVALLNVSRGLRVFQFFWTGLCVFSIEYHGTGELSSSYTSWEQLFVCTLLMRCLRVVMTSPGSASFELTAALALGYSGSPVLTWHPLFLSVCFRATLAGWVMLFCREALGNCSFVFFHVYASLTRAKLRLPLYARLACIIATPIWNFAMALIAAVLGSPVVPIAGGGVFLAGFPRPRRTWPCYKASQADHMEAGYYEQVLPHILTALDRVFLEQSASRFGESMYLLRFEKMIAWVQILEFEFGYRVIHVKGLELQEPTSCHNVEANALDEIIRSERENPTCVKYLHQERVVRPLKDVSIQSYSHSQVSLTGVVGNDEMAKLIHRSFGYAILWQLKKEKDVLDLLAEVSKSENLKFLDGVESKEFREDLDRWYRFIHHDHINATNGLSERGPAGPIGPHGDDFDIDDLLDELDGYELDELDVEITESAPISKEVVHLWSGKSEETIINPLLASKTISTKWSNGSHGAANLKNSEHLLDNGSYDSQRENKLSQVEQYCIHKTSKYAPDGGYDDHDAKPDSLSMMNCRGLASELLSKRDPRLEIGLPNDKQVLPTDLIRAKQLLSAGKSNLESPLHQSQSDTGEMNIKVSFDTAHLKMIDSQAKNKSAKGKSPSYTEGFEGATRRIGMTRTHHEASHISILVSDARNEMSGNHYHQNLPENIRRFPDLEVKVDSGRVHNLLSARNSFQQSPASTNSILTPVLKSGTDSRSESVSGHCIFSSTEDRNTYRSVEYQILEQRDKILNMAPCNTQQNPDLSKNQIDFSAGGTRKEPWGSQGLPLRVVAKHGRIVGDGGYRNTYTSGAVAVADEEGTGNIDDDDEVVIIPRKKTKQKSQQGPQEDKQVTNAVQVTSDILASLGNETRMVSSRYILESFQGEIIAPLFKKKSSRISSFLLRSFRVAIKLALDCFLLGDPDPSLTDLRACKASLEEYELEWHIGSELDLTWLTALQTETPHLLSLVSRGKGELSLLQLSLQQERVTVCSLNPAIVRGIWAALSLELLFLTNDDEERYSIQAHPWFLRNIIIQAAEPPLGYPVYGSGPLGIF